MSFSENTGSKIPTLDQSPGAIRKKPGVDMKRGQIFRQSGSESDSENSVDEISFYSASQLDRKSQLSELSVDFDYTSSTSKSAIGKGKKHRNQRHDWEIMEGLKNDNRCEEKPDKYQGYMLKRRRWPMKGWHKRYFNLEKGFLLYAKSPQDMQKCKYHGVIDVGMSVVAFKNHLHRIYIDAEDIVYHIKIKDDQRFFDWLQRMKHHRLYRQHELAYGTKDSPRLTEITSPIEEVNDLAANLNIADKHREHKLSAEIIRQSSFKRESSQSRVATWLVDTAGFEFCNKELNDTTNAISGLKDDLEQIRSLPVLLESSSSAEVSENDITEKKKSKISRLAKKKDKKNENFANNEFLEVNAYPPGFQDNIRTSCSNPNLMQYELEKLRTSSSSEHEQRIKELKLRERFINRAEQVHSTLASLLHVMATETHRLKRALDSDLGVRTSPTGAAIVGLKQSLSEAHKQIAELKSKLSKIHEESSIDFVTDYKQMTSSPLITPVNPVERERHGLSQSLSADSCSISEYYDAEEYYKENISESSSEASDDDEVSSDISENGTDVTPALSISEDQILDTFQTGRRAKLPVPKPESGDISLWNLLYKNIGKDLTKISMPVTLNEPLSMLQRLCEELEYSELIDKSVDISDPYERMLYIAAFAVSSYASSGYRAGHKPFNPVLGETYECIREDKGWRFVAEQVSHHPPISACYCHSKNYVFSQDIRIKTKFWGKSMEIQPTGFVSLTLPKFKDHYVWNKVTTCVHNLLGGKRWVDQYGEMQIKNGDIVCKLTFTKANHLGRNRFDVYGHILNPDCKVVHNIFGRWNEALYCGHAPSARCIWRPGAMPEDADLYYGFTRFAIELNDLDKEEAKFMPPTDSRFRPDQRLLEEGKVSEAESEKLHVEQLQRERRKRYEVEKKEYEPKWFRKTVVSGKEFFEYTNSYWERRKNPGFVNMTFPKLW